jgi:hypothetical protein
MIFKNAKSFLGKSSLNVSNVKQFSNKTVAKQERMGCKKIFNPQCKKFKILS